MSKYVKNLIMKDITGRFAGVDGVAVINPRGIDATKNNGIRRRLRAKGLRMTVVKNSLARRALADSQIKGFDKLLDGPSALIYGKASIANVAKLLLEEKKTNEKLELRGIFFDGELYIGDAGIKAASKLPTREEAIAGILGLALSPGQNLGAILLQGSKVAGIIKAIEEAAKLKEPKEAAPAPAVAPAAAPAPAAA
jgi:large subunit ribosomal protein L10